MTDTTNGLTLSGTIDRVETTKRVKAKQSYQEDKGGELKLTVLVSRPVAPKRRSVALWGLPDDSPLREMASDYGIDDDALDNVSDDDIAAEIRAPAGGRAAEEEAHHEEDVGRGA